MEVCVVRVSGVSGESRWALEHRSRATVHNHPPSNHAASHPVHRRNAMTTELRVAIATDSDTGTRAAQTLARIYQETPEAPIIARDIYNERSRAVTSALGSSSRVEHLLMLLNRGHFYVAQQVDISRRLTHLFFAHKEALAIWKENAAVLLMDCTYRTNRFNMPLLNIVGISGMNTTLHVAQAFMRGEKKNDYCWSLRQLRTMMCENGVETPVVVFVDRDLALLNALEQVFPDVPVLLCLWHVVKDVETHARKHAFPPVLDVENARPRAPKYQDSARHRLFCDAFLAVVNARTELEYVQRRWEMHMICPSEATYVDDVWLDIWRYRLVRCWTDKVTHFGVVATSRVEGFHATLKGWVGTSSADLLMIHKRLCHWWTQSITKYRVAKSDAEIKVVMRLRGERFAQVVTKIHRYALLKTLGMYMQTQTLLQPCTGVYSRTTGLPCAHQLSAIAILLSEHFHRHWWVHRGSAPERAAAPVLEPECIQDRRKQRAAARAALRKHLSGSGVNGTRRIPSGFEVSIQPNLESVTQTVHHYY